MPRARAPSRGRKRLQARGEGVLDNHRPGHWHCPQNGPMTLPVHAQKQRASESAVGTGRSIATPAGRLGPLVNAHERRTRGIFRFKVNEVLFHFPVRPPLVTVLVTGTGGRGGMDAVVLAGLSVCLDFDLVVFFSGRLGKTGTMGVDFSSSVGSSAACISMSAITSGMSE